MHLKKTSSLIHLFDNKCNDDVDDCCVANIDHDDTPNEDITSRAVTKTLTIMRTYSIALLVF